MDERLHRLEQRMATSFNETACGLVVVGMTEDIREQLERLEQRGMLRDAAGAADEIAATLEAIVRARWIEQMPPVASGT